jgi:hypothetical protein
MLAGEQHAKSVVELLEELHRDTFEAENNPDSPIRKAEAELGRIRNFQPFVFLEQHHVSAHQAAVVLAWRIYEAATDALEPGVFQPFDPKRAGGHVRRFQAYGVLDAQCNAGPKWKEYCERYRQLSPRFDLTQIGAALRQELAPFAGSRADDHEKWLPASQAVERAQRMGIKLSLASLSKWAAKGHVRTRERTLPGNHRTEVEWRSLIAHLEHGATQHGPSEREPKDDAKGRQYKAGVERRKKELREKKLRQRLLE